MSNSETDGLRILSLTLHGLVRAKEIELGRDADTGGQVSYVVDQAAALARDPQVASVEVVTREIVDRRVSPDYARPREEIVPGATIVRLPFGPRRYLHKERLWPYLDGLVDRLLQYLRRCPRLPHVIHAHYADAGYVGSELANMLGIPLVFTGHSLGRVKLERLLEKGIPEETLVKRYNIHRRIEAEERALVTATLVIASTMQEVEEQYASYEHYAPERMEVIPPGVDLSRFAPPAGSSPDGPVVGAVDRFLRHPERPMVLAVARADERKNFGALIEAFAGNSELRERANLVIVAGNRKDIARLPRSQRRVLANILGLVDKHDLYGSVAYPKHLGPEDVPDLYRLAASRRGVFVNVALTEPFGLTLLEAAATGLPVVATRDGGPQDIMKRCRNGILVDPLDTRAIGEAMLRVVSDPNRWDEWSRRALAGAETYSWKSHVGRYLEEVGRIRAGARPHPLRQQVTSRLSAMDRLLVANIDDALVGDDEALAEFLAAFERTSDAVGLAIATGRTRNDALAQIEAHGLPRPEILIAAAGTEIAYGPGYGPDRSWERHIHSMWRRQEVDAVIRELPGVNPQDEVEQTPLRLSYMVDPGRSPKLREINRELRRRKLKARTILSHGMFLDVMPIRASSGHALRFLADKWNLSPERFLVCGTSGNDQDMLSGDTLGVVLANHSPELSPLKNTPRVYFAQEPFARGILEGIRHYRFFEDIQIPGEEDPAPGVTLTEAAPDSRFG